MPPEDLLSVAAWGKKAPEAKMYKAVPTTAAPSKPKAVLTAAPKPNAAPTKDVSDSGSFRSKAGAVVALVEVVPEACGSHFVEESDQVPPSDTPPPTLNDELSVWDISSCPLRGRFCHSSQTEPVSPSPFNYLSNVPDQSHLQRYGGCSSEIITTIQNAS